MIRLQGWYSKDPKQTLRGLWKKERAFSTDMLTSHKSGKNRSQHKYDLRNALVQIREKVKAPGHKESSLFPLKFGICQIIALLGSVPLTPCQTRQESSSSGNDWQVQQRNSFESQMR